MSRLARGLAKIRGTLAVRIYLVGLVQFALVAIGVVVVARESRRVQPSIETLRVIAESIGATADDPVAMARVVADAETALGTKLAVFDETGRLVVGTRLPGPPPHGPPPHGPPFHGHGPPPDGVGGPPPGEPPPPPPDAPWPGDFSDPPPDVGPPGGPPSSVAIPLRDGRTWHLVSMVRPERPSMLRGVGVTVVLVLLVVGVSGWLTARSLAAPLAQLSRAARSFGAGDLDARAALRRSDELGEVSRAFDEMAERVTHALRAERELLANVSHELRTPLQRIQLAIDLAAEGDAATARESLDEIADDLSELGTIVEDVLRAARLSLQAGGNSPSPLPPLHLARVDLGALLGKSAARFRSLHGARRLDVDTAASLPELEVDGVLLRRAIDNLLDNADKYSDDATTAVVLRARQSRDSVAIDVQDVGIGITEKDLARLFEPFFRADRSRTRGTGGLGLGLLLAKRIVEAHGGTLAVESAVGEGTTVRVELPVTPAVGS